MKLNNYFEDNRAVSPVIGVILMVAITVILAAVIGTFVLGLGDSLNQAPQAQMDASTDSSDNVEISHNGGDSIEIADLRITLEGSSNNPYESTGTVSFSLEGTADGEFNVGDTIEIDNGDLGGASGDTQVKVVHVPSESIILNTEITLP